MDNPGDDIIPLNPNDINILRKIDVFIKKYSLQYLHDGILPRTLYGIESDFVSKNKEKVREYTGESSVDYTTEIKLFTNDKAGKAGRAKWFVADRNVICKGTDFINQWQVVVSSANAGGQKRDNQLEIIDNHSAFGRSRVALRSFISKKEAENFYHYVKSYIVRYAFLMTDEALTTLGMKVPDLMDYSETQKLIQFNEDIDKQLFAIMDFTESEIKYIKGIVDGVRKKK